ncbi:MAG: hypothetical protein AW09_002336 [Candidatus Accumulibacter phosphatis]|uniref:Uncharacterized protein n=1 Tax=Candidatus Accumulibacter phosphatis TaxID=327160 RepID=A0A080M5Z3_9PROT|nr:MAG: hypothetical protein AW09_002336 [Candidatus Accumulibacter phosphatis]
MIGRPIGELSSARNVEDADFGATTRVTVADDDDRVAGNQHLVVPGATWIDIAAESVDGGDGPQLLRADADREQAATAQNHQVVAVQLDDATFIDTHVLDVGDRFVLAGGGLLGQRRGCGGGCGGRLSKLTHGLVGARALLLVATTLCLVGPAFEETGKFLFVGESAEGLVRRSRIGEGRYRWQAQSSQRDSGQIGDKGTMHDSPFVEDTEL